MQGCFNESIEENSIAKKKKNTVSNIPKRDIVLLIIRKLL